MGIVVTDEQITVAELTKGLVDMFIENTCMTRNKTEIVWEIVK